jgi:hypothetical protein
MRSKKSCSGEETTAVRRDVTAVDIIMTGAQLAQPLAHVPDWDQVAPAGGNLPGGPWREGRRGAAGTWGDSS